MRRWLTRILVCLLLGAVTTVGVAWGIARKAAAPVAMPAWVLAPPSNDDLWGAYTPSTWGSPDHWESSIKFGFERIRIESGETWHFMFAEAWSVEGELGRGTSGSVTPDSVQRDSWGWPWFCVSQIHVLQGTDDLKRPGAIPFEKKRTRLIWRGAVGNSVLWALIWGCAILIGAGFRRWAARDIAHFRTRRGRCPMCAYDLRGDLAAGCPECGWGREEVLRK